MSFAITRHAVTRYIERIEPVTRAEAYRRIRSHARVIELAIAFGAHTVRTGDGAKLVLSGVTRVRVVTVFPKSWFNGADLPISHPGYRDPAEVWTSAPACCGRCGLPSGNPVVRACIRTDCGRAALFMEDVGS